MVNNSRFLILQEVNCPNLASRVMKLCLQRLSTVKANQKGLLKNLSQAHSAHRTSAFFALRWTRYNALN